RQSSSDAVCVIRDGPIGVAKLVTLPMRGVAPNPRTESPPALESRPPYPIAGGHTRRWAHSAGTSRLSEISCAPVEPPPRPIPRTSGRRGSHEDSESRGSGNFPLDSPARETLARRRVSTAVHHGAHDPSAVGDACTVRTARLP